MWSFFHISRVVLFSVVLCFVMVRPSQAQLRSLFNLFASEYHGSVIRGSNFGQALIAVDESGQEFRFEDFKGKISLVFFGFTLCPDVCPTTLAQLSRLKTELTEEESEQVQVYFITVDPERDTPLRLKEYLNYFDPSFKGLIANTEQLAVIAKSFNIFYNKVPLEMNHYTMEHSSYIFVLDKKADSVLLFRDSMSVEEMLNDIRRLLVK